MKRFARRLFTLCSAVSLVLCVAVCMLWLHSYRVGWRWYFKAYIPPPAEAAPLDVWWTTEGPPRYIQIGPWIYQYRLSGGAGQFELVRLHVTDDQEKPSRLRKTAAPSNAVDLPPAMAGFNYDNQPRTVQPPSEPPGVIFGRRAVGVAGWLPALLLAVLPVLWLRGWLARRRKRRRLVRALCPACGYDLRASPERCPECGAVGAGNSDRTPDPN